MINELLAEYGPALKRHQVELRELAGELVIEATLVTWDEIGADEERALTAFLRRAGGEIRDQQALVIVRLLSSDAESALPTAIERALKARRALEREAAALLRPELARAYLRFQAGEREMLAVGERN